MAASSLDLLQEVGIATATTLDSNYTIGDTTLTVASTSGMPTATGITIAMDVVDSNGEQVPGSYNEYVCVVSTGTSLTSLSHQNGTNRNYSAGATTRVYIPVSAERENRIVEWGLVEHTQAGSHGAITPTSVTSAGTVQGASLVSTGDLQLRSTSVETIRSETEFDFVASGGIWSGDAYASTRNASMTALTCYINGRRGTISAVTARTFTASKDTYVDILNSSGTFSLVYTEVVNNAASPALAANSLRLGIVVTGASNIAAATSINQGQFLATLPSVTGRGGLEVTDSLGNVVGSRDSQRKLLGGFSLGSIASISSSSATAVTNGTTTILVPTGGRNVTIYCDIDCGSDAANLGEYGVQIDGVALKSHRLPMNGTGGWTQQLSILAHTRLTAGSHTVTATAAKAAGTGTVTVNNAAAHVIQHG